MATGLSLVRRSRALGQPRLVARRQRQRRLRLSTGRGRRRLLPSVRGGKAAAQKSVSGESVTEARQQSSGFAPAQDGIWSAGFGASDAPHLELLARTALARPISLGRRDGTHPRWPRGRWAAWRGGGVHTQPGRPARRGRRVDTRPADGGGRGRRNGGYDRGRPGPTAGLGCRSGLGEGGGPGCGAGGVAARTVLAGRPAIAHRHIDGAGASCEAGR